MPTNQSITSAEGYKCSITKEGYVRCYVGRNLHKFEHVLAWEAANGPIPAGMEIHHKNGVKTDNRLENLELLSHLEHNRLHAGARFINGVWWRSCTGCGEWLEICDANFYRYPEGYFFSACKPCKITRSVRDKRRRAAQRARKA